MIAETEINKITDKVFSGPEGSLNTLLCLKDIMDASKLLATLQERKSVLDKGFSTHEAFLNWAHETVPYLKYNIGFYSSFQQSIATLSIKTLSAQTAGPQYERLKGVLTQAIVELENGLGPIENNQQEKTTVPSTRKTAMKEKFENHPVVFGATMLIIGFCAGLTVMNFLYPLVHPNEETSPNQAVVNNECNLDGVPLLNEAHHKRLAILQEQLMKLEGQAADKNNYVYSSGYEDAAARVRKDIKQETEQFQNSLNLLASACKKT